MYGIIVINIHELRTMPVYRFGGDLKKIEIAMKVITQEHFDNPHLMLSNTCGDLFSLAVYKQNTVYDYEISIWDYKGLPSVYVNKFHIDNSGDPIPKNIINELQVVTERYSKGFVKCSDCKKEISIENAGGRYFAGIYCIDCWLGNTGEKKEKGGWKYIESQENYN